MHCYDIDGDYLPAAYVWGIWRAPIQIEDLPANPFLEGAVDITDSTDLPWWYFDVMILWGGFSQRCGYWPGLESRGSPKTGQMYDEGPWSLSLYTGRVIAYVAIYSDTTGYFRGRLVPSVT